MKEIEYLKEMRLDYENHQVIIKNKEYQIINKQIRKSEK